VVEAGWEELASDPLQVDHADAVAGRDAVIAALARLPPRQRELLGEPEGGSAEPPPIEVPNDH
jgi:DNA-directed RNA polymerase specialized sigma24 family protein